MRYSSMVYLIDFVVALLKSFGKRMLELDVESGCKSGAGCEVCDTSLLPHASPHHVDCAHQLQELCPFPDYNIPPPSIPAPGHNDSTKSSSPFYPDTDADISAPTPPILPTSRPFREPEAGARKRGPKFYAAFFLTRKVKKQGRERTEACLSRSGSRSCSSRWRRQCVILTRRGLRVRIRGWIRWRGISMTIAMISALAEAWGRRQEVGRCMYKMGGSGRRGEGRVDCQGSCLLKRVMMGSVRVRDWLWRAWCKSSLQKLAEARWIRIINQDMTTKHPRPIEAFLMFIHLWTVYHKAFMIRIAGSSWKKVRVGRL